MGAAAPGAAASLGCEGRAGGTGGVPYCTEVDLFNEACKGPRGGTTGRLGGICGVVGLSLVGASVAAIGEV